MWLSDISVKRPVLATVINLLLIAFGIVSFARLALREYPDIDPPVISIETVYEGAAANVVQTRVTELIEDSISGIEGVRSITSQSADGISTIAVEFRISRDIDGAANDVRDRVSGIANLLPEEVDAPRIQKADADEDVIIWFNLTGEGMTIDALTDYARRYVQDRFSSLDGVARVRVGGGQERAMRIWLDRDALAARNLTAEEVERALRRENVELPAGSLQSVNRDFTVRVERQYHTPDDFRDLVISRGEGQNAYLVRLSDVARVEIGAEEERNLLRGNGVPMVGVGIVKQSKANTLEVARLARAEQQRVNKTLPGHMELRMSYDTSIFIESSVHEVYKTLLIAIVLVVAVIYIFLGSAKAMLVPAVTVPVSLIAAFIVLYAFGLSVNLLTLLALVLAIGLVVDDAIVVLENIHRRVEMGEPRLLAAFRGTRQVGFAVIATTLVLVAVFLPLTFLEGDIGRLFSEFAITLSVAVLFSGFVALTLCPVMASRLLDKHDNPKPFSVWIDRKFDRMRSGYVRWLKALLARKYLGLFMLLAMFAACFLFYRMTPREFAPQEDRGAFFLFITGPEGSSYDYTVSHVDEIERRLMPFVESGEFERLLMRVPGSFTATESFHDARGIVLLADWKTPGRKSLDYYLEKVREMTADIPGVLIFPVVRQAFGRRADKPVQFVISGGSYDELAEWRDVILEKAAENPGLQGVDHDYKETRPQVGVLIDRDRAGDLGVSIAEINRTLETMLGSRRVTTFIDRGEEYDVIIEGKKSDKQSPFDIDNIYVRSERSAKLIPLSSLVTLREFAAPSSLNRYNRLRSITIQSGLAEGYHLGEALDYLDALAKTELPPGVTVDYKGDSREYRDTGGAVSLMFLLALLVVFLVLAGQFESFIHPVVIMATVPLAICGALLALWITGQSLNIYSQIGLIILVGIAAKNGILIVEFANQLRDEGIAFHDAIIESSAKRLRPIIMTSVTTAAGAVPLMISHGAGAETRMVIGTVIFAGVIVATFFTIFLIPALYHLMAARTASPHARQQRLEAQAAEYADRR